MPNEMKPTFPTAGDDAKMVSVLTNTSINYLHQWRSQFDVEELLMYVARPPAGQPPYRVLIDAGALITGMTNEEVAKFILSHLGSWARAAVYIDAQDRKMVAPRSGGPSIPLEQSSIAWSERFTFYDREPSHPLNSTHTRCNRLSCNRHLTHVGSSRRGAHDGHRHQAVRRFAGRGDARQRDGMARLYAGVLAHAPDRQGADDRDGGAAGGDEPHQGGRASRAVRGIA